MAKKSKSQTFYTGTELQELAEVLHASAHVQAGHASGPWRDAFEKLMAAVTDDGEQEPFQALAHAKWRRCFVGGSFVMKDTVNGGTAWIEIEAGEQVIVFGDSMGLGLAYLPVSLLPCLVRHLLAES